MRHIEKRANLFYAVLTIPPDVRHLLGKMRFVKSLQTDKRTEAQLRASMLVAGWRGEIERARGSMPNPKDEFWKALRKDFLAAKDEAHLFAVQDLIEEAAGKVGNEEESSQLYRTATGQAPERVPLGPLLVTWKGSLVKLAQKTVDQRHRDVLRMADHFQYLDRLTPKAVKAWTDGLVAEGATTATIDRVGEGCRSFWSYLRQSGTVTMIEPSPFDGPFTLALKTAKRTTVTRVAFTTEDLSRVYQRATEEDPELARVIALGAYTGCRIEELFSLTVADCAGGAFVVGDAKTAAGNRQIPIHPALSTMVQALTKASTDGYLLPSTAAGKYGVRSDPASKRFGRLKAAMKFGPGHVFHSIRKTVATQLEQAGVPEGIAADILGHEKQTLSYGLYSSGSSMTQKLEALSKVAYPTPLDGPRQ